MIKYNNSNINDWYFYTSDIVKVYRNNAVCYYKIISSGDTPTQVPCFAVVDDISQYSDTEFEDVFNKADGKWYKLNNLNQYEEYGVYGNGRSITYYQGKLTIDGDYEYQYSGNSWVNVGEVSGSTQTIKSPEYIQLSDTSNRGGIQLLNTPKEGLLIEMDFELSGSTASSDIQIIGQKDKLETVSYQMGFEQYNSWTGGYYDYGGGRLNMSSLPSFTTRRTWLIGRISGSTSSNIVGCYCDGIAKTTTKASLSFDANRPYCIGDIIYSGSTTPIIGTANLKQMKLYSVKIYEDYGTTLVGDYIPVINDNNNIISLVDKISGNYANSYGTIISSSNYSYVVIGDAVYPIYYDEKLTPPNNLTFSSMTDAEEYECPWVGMVATIDGTKYVFSGDSTSGYEWVYNPSRLPQGYTEVEYVENTGTSYFDTNFVPNQDTRIVADMQMVTQTSYWPRLWGAGTYSSANGLTIAYQDASGTRCLQISWFGDTSWTSYSSVVENTNRHVYDLNKNYMYIDEALVGSHTYTTNTASDHLGVFTYIASGRPGSSSFWGKEHFLGKMYSFQVYDNGTLVRDLVPCIRDNDNKVGAYDIVNDVFYTVPTGYTTDQLIAGDPV